MLEGTIKMTKKVKLISEKTSSRVWLVDSRKMKAEKELIALCWFVGRINTEEKRAIEFKEEIQCWHKNKLSMNKLEGFNHHKHSFLEYISIRNSRGKDQVIFQKTVIFYERFACDCTWLDLVKDSLFQILSSASDLFPSLLRPNSQKC